MITVAVIFLLQIPVCKEPLLTIPGTPAIVQHEFLNNRRQVLTKVTAVVFFSIAFIMRHLF